MLAYSNLALFYLVFTPLTIYPLFFFLSLLFPASLSSANIIIGTHIIEIIHACIAGAAYYLLTILNLTTPMPLKKRIQALAFSYFSLLILNILRLFILSYLFLNTNPFFSLTHKIFWYLLSIIFVIGIWFLSVYLFEIKSIPAYTDIKEILKEIKKKR